MVREYILSVISISISGLILDALLPDGNIHKYANFALSVILSIVLIQPIVSFFNKDFNVEYEKVQYSFDYTDAVLRTVNSISGFEDADVEVEQDNNKIQSITVKTGSEKIIEKAEEEIKKDYVKKILSTIYGVENVYFSE